MKTTRDFLDDAWRRLAGLPPKDRKLAPPLEEIFRIQWSQEFEMYMRNRLAIGLFRYGRLDEQPPGKFDSLGSLKKRLAMYENPDSHLYCNDEVLVDCANLLMVEFMKGTHPNKHFKTVDDGVHVQQKEKP